MSERQNGSEEQEATGARVALSERETERLSRMGRSMDAIAASDALRQLTPEAREIAAVITAGFAEVARAIEDRDG